MVVLAFVTLLLAALAIGATLYRYFGIFGAVIEVGAVVLAVIWTAGLARSRTSPVSGRRWAAAGAACLVLAHLLFWLLVNPVNEAFAVWTPANVPADWTWLRDQWEFTHAARCGLLGFGALLASALAARPGGTGRGKSTG